MLPHSPLFLSSRIVSNFFYLNHLLRKKRHMTDRLDRKQHFKTLSAEVTVAFLERVGKEADRRHITKSELVRRAIAEYLGK